MQLISTRRRVTDVSYALDFYSDGEICLGFPCDMDGNVFMDKLPPAALENLNNAKTKNLMSRVNEYSNTYTEPAVGICENCKKEVQLTDDYCGATECECGQWYAIGGYAIQPPHLWEEPIDDY